MSGHDVKRDGLDGRKRVTGKVGAFPLLLY